MVVHLCVPPSLSLSLSLTGMALAQGLRKKLLNLCSSWNPCKNSGCISKEEDDAEEPDLILGDQKVEVHERGYHMAARRGPRPPGFGKGPPPQTS